MSRLQAHDPPSGLAVESAQPPPPCGEEACRGEDLRRTHRGPGRHDRSTSAESARHRRRSGSRPGRRGAVGGADTTGDQHGDRRPHLRATLLARGVARRSTGHARQPDGRRAPRPQEVGPSGGLRHGGRRASFDPVPGVDFFRSRRPFEVLVSPRPGIPRCRLEPAVLLWAAYEASNRAAHGVIAATVQQRLTTPGRLIEWVDLLQPLRRAKPFKRTLSFVDAGAHSGAELEVGRMCRRFGMPQPTRQTRRKDRWGGPRWTDAEWDLADGHTIVLEVEGGFHTDVLEAAADARRSRRLTTRTRTVVRCTAYELIHELAEVAIDLIDLGIPGRLPPGRVPTDAA